MTFALIEGLPEQAEPVKKILNRLCQHVGQRGIGLLIQHDIQTGEDDSAFNTYRRPLVLVRRL